MNVPILGIPSRDEELDLIAQAQAPGADDTAARDELLLRHWRFVAATSQQFARRVHREDLREDLADEAVLGFFEAISLFDAAYGVRLVTYARTRMDYRMREALGREQLIHVPPQAQGGTPKSARGKRTRAFCRAAAEQARRPPGRVDRLEIVDEQAEDPALLAERAEERELLRSGLESIDPGRRSLLAARVGLDGEIITQQEIAIQMGVSKQAVCRQEAVAMRSLRRAVRWPRDRAGVA